jgi:hypothetical protein
VGSWYSGAYTNPPIYPKSGIWNTEADYALLDVNALADNNNSNFKYNFVTMTNLPLAEWYRLAMPADGKLCLDYSPIGTLEVGDAPVTGLVRYTGPGADPNSPSLVAIETATDSHLLKAGGAFQFMIHGPSKATPITFQFDGAGGKDNPDGKYVNIDYSTVVFTPPTNGYVTGTLGTLTNIKQGGDFTSSTVSLTGASIVSGGSGAGLKVFTSIGADTGKTVTVANGGGVTFSNTGLSAGTGYWFAIPAAKLDSVVGGTFLSTAGVKITFDVAAAGG